VGKAMSDLDTLRETLNLMGQALGRIETKLDQLEGAGKIHTEAVMSILASFENRFIEHDSITSQRIIMLNERGSQHSEVLGTLCDASGKTIAKLDTIAAQPQLILDKYVRELASPKPKRRRK
jgi:hypothetical protein